MAKQFFNVTDGRETKQYPENKRKEIINFYTQGAEECDGSESERYYYIADSLFLGATDVNGDNQTCVFPVGSKGALFEAQIIKEMNAFIS